MWMMSTWMQASAPLEKTTDTARQLIEAVTMPIFAEHVPTTLTGEADLTQALEQLRRPHHTMLVVTLGSRGAMALAGGTVHRAEGIAVKTVDTTGAGDVFRGAFIYAMLRGDAPADILRFANAAAAVSCTKRGAMNSVPSLQEVEGL
jgi:sulfofructose kinase